MSDLSVDTKLSIRKKKKKIYVVDGIISYPLAFTDDTIQCICKDSSKTKNPHELCKHVIYYMYSNGLDLLLLDYWIRMRQYMVPQLLTKTVNNRILWDTVEKEIFNAECPICLDAISINKQYSVCSTCQHILHESCYKKWDKKGNGCAMCRTV